MSSGTWMSTGTERDLVLKLAAFSEIAIWIEYIHVRKDFWIVHNCSISQSNHRA